jgi:hypothetical protein
LKTINISVRDKLPLVTSMSGRAVADNRYRLVFDFDDEWVEGLKTVVIAVSAKQYRMYPTTADYVDIELGGERYITVGVIQDTIATSQPCQILVNESIRKHMGEEIELPEPDVWTYITDQIRTLNSLRLYPVEKTAAMTQQVGVDAERRLWTYPGGSGGSGGIDRISIVSSTPSDGPTEYILRVHMTDGRAIDCKLPNMGIALSDVITVSPSSPLETAEVGQVGELWFDTTMRILYVCIMAGTAIGEPNWIAVGGSSSPGGGNSSGSRGVLDVVSSVVSAETNGTVTYDMVVSLEDGTKITRRLPGFRNEDVVMFHNGAPSETLLAPRGKLLFDTDWQNMYVCADISGNGSDTKTIWKPISASGVHVGDDTPPAGTRVWVNPNGKRTEIPKVDDTPTKPGYAADAAKVGEKINQLSGEIGGLNEHHPNLTTEQIAMCKKYAIKILEASGKTENFLFFTDPHFGGAGDPIAATEPYLRQMAAVYNRTPVSMCVSGGDWLNNSNTKDNACWQLGYFDGVMKGLFDKYVMVVGNHDTNYQGFEYMESEKDGTYDREEHEKCVLPVTAQSNLWNRKYGKSYFAFDGDCTRFYVFDTGLDWYPDMDEYRWEQVDWFADALLADDSGRSAAFMHIVGNSAETVTPMLDAITQIANAYNTRASITLNDTTYDFSAMTGKFWFVMAGHKHADVSYSVNGIPVIVTINAFADREKISFDLVLADYDANKIHMVRVGSGDVRVISLVSGSLIIGTNLFDIGTTNSDYISLYTHVTTNDLVINAERGTLTAPSVAGGARIMLRTAKIENPKTPVRINATISNEVDLPAAHGICLRFFDAAGNAVTEWENGWSFVSYYSAFRLAHDESTLPSVCQFDETITLPDNVETFQIGFQFTTPKTGEAGTLVTFSDISVVAE